MGAFVSLRWVLNFFSLFFQGHTSTGMTWRERLVFPILLCLHMLFRKVCIVQKPPIPALHLQIILYFWFKDEEIFTLKSFQHVTVKSTQQTKNPNQPPVANDRCHFLTWACCSHLEAHLRITVGVTLTFVRVNIFLLIWYNFLKPEIYNLLKTGGWIYNVCFWVLVLTFLRG